MNLDTPLCRARTFLFVPGNRPERFDKALSSGADVVVLDLEDAVAMPDKPAARAAVRAAWPTLRQRDALVVVRVNAPSTFAGHEDLEWLRSINSPPAIMVPKAGSQADLRHFQGTMAGCPLLPLIETAAGYAGLAEIAAHRQVLRLVLGHLDFMADTGLRCSDDERELDSLRFEIAIQTRLCGLAPAVDGVTAAIDDDGRLRADVARALNFGFGGKLCIHPKQVASVHTAMDPSSEELAWARRVVAADEAAGGAAMRLDGHMVDVPVVLRARRVLALARPGLEV
jgi:citrate lyase subunit beta/citryl-CoA lyase